MSIKAQVALKGQLKSDNGEVIPFATVGIKTSQISVITNAEGLFEIKGLKQQTYTLLFHCLGFLDRTEVLQIEADKTIEVVMEASNKQLEEVVVNANRVDKTSGMAFNNVDSETLKKQNFGQDAPYMLGQLTGVVVNSDAGNGIGYTGLRIRGSDGTRINLTINGVPVNDAESQATFFVNMPDLVSSTDNIQVQRGVGASSNGAGAFGASINFQTSQFNDKAYAKVISTYGSFNTRRNTLMAGTGLLNNKFTLDARASKITSDGYIDRAFSNLHSYYLAAGYYGKKSIIKFINFLGKEKTYQAWNYVPEDSIKMGNRTYNEIGAYTDAYGKLNFYNNETDNYQQNNFQLHIIHPFSSRLILNITGHYTKGAGYYEQYKQDAKLSSYNIAPLLLSVNDSTTLTIKNSDIIRRRWLDNDFAGGIFNLNYRANEKLSFILGGGYNTYFGKHFGNVIWTQFASNSSLNHQYYMNTGNKNDGNAYLKMNYKPIQKLNVFVDAQVRYVDYSFVGINDVLLSTKQLKSFVFFNPKVGMSYNLNQFINMYASFAVANKEPNRNDFVENTPANRPKHEQLFDTEFGMNYSSKRLNAGINFYNMSYKNQLVLNGQVNDVGAAKRVNVENSYRRGVELEARVNINPYLNFAGNIALSQNKISEFVEYTDSSNADYSIYTQYKKVYKNTDILLSPKVVSSLIMEIKPYRDFEISVVNKYVGRQFLDNTSNIKRSINPYYVVDLRFNYKVKTQLIPELSLMLSINNVFSTLYETTGYTYSYYTDATLNTFNYKAPAAPINWLGGFSLKF